MRPSSCSRCASTAAASAIAVTAAPRSRASASAARSAPVPAATSSRVMSGVARGGSERADVRQQHLDPGVREPVAQERVLVALRVERPDQQDRRAHELSAQSGPAPSRKSGSSRSAFSAPPGL